MNKIIKVTNDEILVGTDEGSIIKTERANASWDAKVGDKVEIFSNGDTVILTLRQKHKERKENMFVSKTVGLCQKIFPIVFSCLLVVFLAAFLVICNVPRGKKYVIKNTAIVEYDITITFDGDEMIIKSTNLFAEEGEDKYVVNSTKYAIVDGELYEYNELTEEYDLIGEISSTKLSLIIDNYRIVFKENTMISLKTWSLILMIVSAVLDLACIVVFVLTKKGVIDYQLGEDSSVMTYVQPLNVSSEPIVRASEEKPEEKPVKIEEVIAEVPTETQEESAQVEEKKVIKVKPKDPSDMTIKDMLSKLNGELDDDE